MLVQREISVTLSGKLRQTNRSVGRTIGKVKVRLYTACAANRRHPEALNNTSKVPDVARSLLEARRPRQRRLRQLVPTVSSYRSLAAIGHSGIAEYVAWVRTAVLCSSRLQRTAPSVPMSRTYDVSPAGGARDRNQLVSLSTHGLASPDSVIGHHVVPIGTSDAAARPYETSRRTRRSTSLPGVVVRNKVRISASGPECPDR